MLKKRLDENPNPELTKDDQLLVRQISEGDVRAFTSLVTKYLFPVTRFAYNMVRSEDAAEDIAQNVFIQLWERRAGLGEIRSIKAYLFRIVKNIALNERKAFSVRKRHQAQVYADPRQGIVPGQWDREESLLLTTTTVQEAIHELPERRQLVLRLRLEDELSHAEIGEILGISPQAAQVLAGRALAELRKKLGVFD